MRSPRYRPLLPAVNAAGDPRCFQWTAWAFVATCAGVLLLTHRALDAFNHPPPAAQAVASSAAWLLARDREAALPSAASRFATEVAVPAARPAPAPLREYCGRPRAGPAFEAQAGAAVAACVRGEAFEAVGALEPLAEGDDPADEVCLPAFIMIGTGKSGTSTLANLFKQLPVPPGGTREISQAFMGGLEDKAVPDLKFLMQPDAAALLDRYAEMFDPGVDNHEDKVGGAYGGNNHQGRKKFEKTAFYYDSLLAACNQKVFLPEARALYGLRSPVARAVSQYTMFLTLLVSKVLAVAVEPGHPPLTNFAAVDRWRAPGPVHRAAAFAELDDIAAQQREQCGLLRAADTGGPWTVADLLRVPPRGGTPAEATGGLVSIEELFARANAPEALPEANVLRIIQNSLYYTHIQRWFQVGFDPADVCYVALEDLKADSPGAIRHVFECLGVQQLPDEEWIAQHEYGSFQKNSGSLDKGTARGFFLYGSASKIAANSADFTLEEAYEKARPIVDEAVACFRAALQEKAPALYHDDVMKMQQVMGRELDLGSLWGIEAPVVPT